MCPAGDHTPWTPITHAPMGAAEAVERLEAVLDRVELNASLLANAAGLSDREIVHVQRATIHCDWDFTEPTLLRFAHLSAAIADARWLTAMIPTELDGASEVAMAE